MKTLELNEMENLIGSDPCDSGEIVGNMVGAAIAGAIFGGPIGYLIGVGGSAVASLVACGLSGISAGGGKDDR